MKKNKLIKFARFGGLSPVIQKGYDKTMPTFHSPPAKKGIYCFIYPYYVPFLLSGDFSNIDSKHSKFQYLKNKNGDRVEFDDDNVNNDLMYDKNFMKTFTNSNNRYYDDEKDEWVISNKKSYWVKPKKPKIFTYTGKIWHHLGEHLKQNQIITEKGKWFLSEYYDFAKAFQKEKHNCIKETHKMRKKDLGEKNFLSKLSNNNPFLFIANDHLEVFIEKLK